MTDLMANTVFKDNENLIKDLKITRKLLETYRNCLFSFTKSCKCVANKENETKFNKLEEYYTKVNHKIVIKVENTETDPIDEVEPNSTYLLSQQKSMNTSKDFIDENEVSNIFDSDDDNTLLELKSTDKKNNKKVEKTLSKTNSKNKALKKFVCQYCGNNKNFRSNYHLVRHIRSCHSLEKPFKCLKCEMKFPLSDRLSQHVKIHHKDYPVFRCNQQNCDFETIIEERLTAHWAKHRNLIPIKCDVCLKSFLTNSELNSHKKKYHFNSEDIADPMDPMVKIDSNTDMDDSNPAIDESFFSDFDFDQNSVESPPPSQVSVRKSNKQVSKSKGSEVKKVAKPRKHKRRATETGDVFCEESGCGKKFLSQHNLQKHMRTVHSELRPYVCEWPGCDTAFKTREAMNCHLAGHRNERNHKCDIEGCDKGFNTRQELHQHKRSHGINKIIRYPCSWPACNVFCQSALALSEHMNRHQNIRPFKCDHKECDKSYFTAYELRQHVMKSHDKNKSFRCDYKDCAMSYLNKRDLAKHRRLHEDMATFICSWPECGRTFNTSKDLSDHMNRHMNIRANKCSFVGCDRSYFKRADLTRHIKLSHCRY